MYPPNQEAYGKYPSNPSVPPFQPGPVTGIPVASYNENPPFPIHQVPQGQGREGPWSTGLCDCCTDCKTCCLTCWCPCITFGRIAEIVDKGDTSCGTAGALYGLLAWFTGCGCLYSCGYRSKLRREYMLPESPCNDCLVHCCCERCALCQEYRELKNRGFDMSIGWHENMDRQNRGVPMAAAPVFEGAMTR